MNLNQILTEIEKADSEVYERLDNRRDTMREFFKYGGKVALAAVPLALGGMFKKAYGQNNTVKASILDVLNFALTLEYLEAEFYVRAVETPGLIPTGGTEASMAFRTIRDHEVAHVAFLQTTIRALGGTPVTKPTFDFTAGGTFPTVFRNFQVFLAVSQTFEDTGVRAYKGQATNLMSNNDVLTAALRIHSVEARHASHVRSERAVRLNDTSIRPWIIGNSTAGIGSAVQASYAGEENTVQLGIEITNINGYDINMNDASASFDEPLTMNQVLAIVSPFIVS